MRKSEMLNLDVIIFDIDGVLVDVSESFRDAIRQTTQLYLEAVMGLSPANGELVSREDVAAFKLAGGFNNDWDLTTGILRYFIAMLDSRRETQETPPKTMDEIIAFLRRAGNNIVTNVEELRQQKKLIPFAEALRARGGGLAAVREILGDRNAHLLFAEGDLRGTNLVQRLFEEIYLGEALFNEEYGAMPLFYHGPGLIRRERLIPSQSALAELGKRVALGIATGRPRHQATFTLETAGILGLFRSLVAFEDIATAEEKLYHATGERTRLSKPHPFALLEAAQRIMPAPARCAYVGDTLDDVRAANAAKSKMDFVSIACLAGTEDKETMRGEFERIGADVIVEHPDDLVEMVEK